MFEFLRSRGTIAMLGLGLAAASASAASLSISIGVRETGTAAAIGGNGGTTNGIEFVNLDGQSLPIDGAWHPFTFNFGTDPVTAFAGATANGILDGTSGALEHIRIRSGGGVFNGGPISIWIDSITNTEATGASTVFGDFEGFAANQEVMFRQPSFSGSTSGLLALAPNFSGVDNTVANTGTGSYRSDFKWNTAAASNWLRLTTFNTGTLPNPAIRFGAGSSLTFWARAIPEPSSVLLLAVGALGLLRRR